MITGKLIVFKPIFYAFTTYVYLQILAVWLISTNIYSLKKGGDNVSDVKNTHCSTQWAAVIAQFSFRSAAPHLCRYVDVLYCRSEICHGHWPKLDFVPPTMRPCGHSLRPHTASTSSVEFNIIVQHKALAISQRGFSCSIKKGSPKGSTLKRKILTPFFENQLLWLLIVPLDHRHWIFFVVLRIRNTKWKID